ncbi:type II secretion system protein N [Ramlibacter tataouinensis]|uniref:type II secretion system protein N n=1 Tax=Ramlibacter tataouinensis TaxID=94132 RepID=UPI0022F3A3C6|nr:type II secretion system protein N [Ramlibacter tataouinensis]WBY03805.1 type II secretion system protein N [Ramlibacter tataouinensis]
MTLLVWAAAAASAAYWGLKMSGQGAAGPVVAAGLRQPAAADPAAVARLLGASGGTAQAAASPQPSAASRFQLVGVVADKSEQGAALIVVDGKPARPYRVGARVDEGLVLQSVQSRRAVLAPSMQGEPAVTLELPVPR